jgi:hypothetical protein
MKLRTSYRFAATLLLMAAACARQEDPDDIMVRDDDGDNDTAGKLNLGTSGSGGGGSGSLSIGGTNSTPKGGATSKGGGTALPPSGSVGGKGGKGSGGSSGSANEGGADTGGSTSGGTGGSGSTVNMPVDGLTMAFKADSTTSEVDWLGGELLFSNGSTEDFALGDLKIRYYFTNEIASPMTEVRWSQFGPASNMGNKSCSAKLVEMPTPKTGADSYIEITCEAGDMATDAALKTSWRAGANGSSLFKLQQADDYSFNNPEHIVVLNGNTVIWGVEP